MTQSTTLVTACEAHIRLDNDSGTPIDISGSSNAIQMGFAQEVQEYYTMYRGRAPMRNASREDASIDIDVIYSVTAGESVDLLTDWFFNHKGTRRTLTIYIPDYTIGSDMYTGEVLLETLEIPAIAEASVPIPVQVKLLPSGAWIKATKAT